MDCFWICCDDADNVLSVNNIHIGTQKTGGEVTWHTNKRTSGTWWCCTGEADRLTYLLVEFAAWRGWYKRHVLQEVGPNLFKLEGVDHLKWTIAAVPTHCKEISVEERRTGTSRRTIIPGNALSPDNKRKTLAVYITCKDLPQWMLQLKNCWMCVAVIRTGYASAIDGNVSSCMRCLFEHFIRNCSMSIASGTTSTSKALCMTRNIVSLWVALLPMKSGYSWG